MRNTHITSQLKYAQYALRVTQNNNLMRAWKQEKESGNFAKRRT